MKMQGKILRKVLSVLLCLALIATLVPVAAFGAVPVSKVVIADKSVSLQVGKTYYLDERVSVFPYGGYVSKSYTSSAPGVASVSSSGAVKGIKAGASADITVTAGGKSAKVTVKVVKAEVPAKLLVMAPNITINKGKSVSFPVQLQPVTASNLIKSATSSNKKVAVPVLGFLSSTIKGVGVGTAKITLIMKSGAKAVFNVTVTSDKLPTSVSFTKAPEEYLYNSSNMLLTKGQKVQIAAQAVPTNVKAKTIVYYSDNTAVAKIDAKGNISAVGEGKARIYAIAVGGLVLNYFNVHVGPIAVRDVVLMGPEKYSTTTLDPGETMTAKAAVWPINATNTNLKWESDDTSVATVDANGKVTMMADGSSYKSTKITVRALGGDEYTYSYFYVKVKTNY